MARYQSTASDVYLTDEKQIISTFTPMRMERTNELSAPLTALRLLVHASAGSTSLAERRVMYDLLGSAIDQGALEGYASGTKRGIAPLEQLLSTVVIASRELHLDLDSLKAILFFRPLLEGVLTSKEIEPIVGKGALRLIGLLQKASVLFLRKESISSENFHNLLLSMAEDIRVILIIIADRLYRLRHASKLYNTEEAVTLAVEVSFLYAPIAHRLGLYTIKGEMEDLCLKWRDRKTFDFIVRKLGETKETRDNYIQAFIAPLRKVLDVSLDVPYQIKGRVKSISSIHNKLRKQSFEDIYDLFAIRIILDAPLERERSLCWQVYSIVTDMYRPNPERLKDWISIPKSNGYESLHITVMGSESRWVEVQIRTERMDAIAEQGVAAHWKYKGIKSEKGLDEFLASVRETLEDVRDNPSPEGRSSILEGSMMTLSTPEIYVFTPRGEVIKLPKGATVLDFAFTIHSRVGAQASSGKVNGKNVSLRYQLQNGDSVEIITSPQQTPKKDWLSIVVSSRARARIRQLLRAEEEAGIDVAKELIQRRLKNRKLPYNEALFIRLTIRKGYRALSDFYRDITLDKLDAGTFIDAYEAELKSIEQQAQEQNLGNTQVVKAEEFVAPQETPTSGGHPHEASDILVIDQGLSGVAYSFAKCCQPVYGDQIFGFVSTRGIKIHRLDCPNAPDMIERTGHRVLSARWSGEEGYDSQQLVQIAVVGRDDIAVVTHVISLIKKEAGCSLRSYTIDSGDGLFNGLFMIYVRGLGSMTNLIKKIRGAVGVKQVNRL